MRIDKNLYPLAGVYRQELTKVRKQRDELLAAHRRINEAVPPHDTSWLAHDWAAYIIKLQAISSAAIAACEEEQT